ncbi:hypothetical protein SeLEV6574_g04767 [Synchytrium endobioticum]|uniref:Uncharacterized protein n=1 Tax=Synchytrium endobioticum TaxID=286115 RepID=A0A507CY72_9FUNG|nr:hypothetical protein SeLEV6574_g04767 [Synchytrium endobioticum]
MDDPDPTEADVGSMIHDAINAWSKAHLSGLETLRSLEQDVLRQGFAEFENLAGKFNRVMETFHSAHRMLASAMDDGRLATRVDTLDILSCFVEMYEQELLVKKAIISDVSKVSSTMASTQWAVAISLWSCEPFLETDLLEKVREVFKQPNE